MFISLPKHMLWVLNRTPKNMFKLMGKKIITILPSKKFLSGPMKLSKYDK